MAMYSDSWVDRNTNDDSGVNDDVGEVTDDGEECAWYDIPCQIDEYLNDDEEE